VDSLLPDAPERARGPGALWSSLVGLNSVYGQSIRFVLTGGLVAFTYFAVTTALSQLVGLPFQIALAIGTITAVALHFTLQRLFVWQQDAGYALSLGGQLTRYLVVAGVQYGITALATAFLPSILGVPVIVVYLVTGGLLTIANFLLFRNRVFHAPPSA
jgi:putative flippase GtrA